MLKRYSSHESVIAVTNYNFHDGLFSSIQCGVVNVESDYFFISHGDMPHLDASIYQKSWQFKGDKPVFLTYKGQRGHPVLLSKKLIPKIIQARSSNSMKNWLKDFDSLEVSIDDAAILQDVDM